MPPHPHTHWRDLKEWRHLDLPMSTASDEACKMFDAVLTQYVSYCNDPSIGGMAGCIDKMITADPNFVMGHVIKLASQMKRVQTDSHFSAAYEDFNSLLKTGTSITPWERKHVEALTLKARGYNKRACQVWEDILADHPRDMLSLKLLYDSRAFEGDFIARRDCCARVLPYWKEDMPLYGDLQAMYAFGMEENNYYTEAEIWATKALDKNRNCVFASHCIAHCKEMTGKPQEGISFMESTESSWNDSMLGCHCYWHWALFHYESGDFQSAAGILENHLYPSLKSSESMMAVTDVSSLCFRLEAEDYDVSRYWDDCIAAVKQHKDDHVWAFWQVHGMLAGIGARHEETAQEVVKSVKDFIMAGEGDIADIYADVVIPLFDALQAYGDKAYGKAVDIMKPIRYKIHRVGASVAQRDLFTLLTVHAGLRSKEQSNVEFARQLLHVRQAVRGDTDLVDRLLAKCVTQTEDNHISS